MSEEEEWDGNKIAATESNLAHQVHGILNDECFSMPSGGSGSSFVKGRIRVITSENPAQFQFAVDALESAHRDQNVTAKYLLTTIHQYVTEAHKASHKTDTQRSAISQWCTPDWADMLKYDPVTQKVVSQGITKGAAKAQKYKAIDHGQLLEQIACELQFEGSHKLLGNMSSPRTTPLCGSNGHNTLPWSNLRVWPLDPLECISSVTFVDSGGLPFFRERRSGNNPPDESTRAHQRNGQLMTMGLLACGGRYSQMLDCLAIAPSQTPSWDTIEFSSNPDEDECVQRLTERGITCNEAGDASDYTHTWLQKSCDSERTSGDTQLRIAINSLLDRMREYSSVCSWDKVLTFTYHFGLSRWMPVLPTAGVTSGVTLVVTTAANVAARSLSMVRPGTSDLQPQPLPPVSPVTEVAGPNPAPARADKVANMHVDNTVSLRDQMDIPKDEAQASSLT
jgi:hypothetical protein